MLVKKVVLAILICFIFVTITIIVCKHTKYNEYNQFIDEMNSKQKTIETYKKILGIDGGSETNEN